MPVATDTCRSSTGEPGRGALVGDEAWFEVGNAVQDGELLPGEGARLAARFRQERDFGIVSAR
ncbi:hypothetical protein EAO75_44540 [Streptomyces sp. uw30]|uniref:hypothetical protein n=1 Tax=Streptomyces sp. uw30 TaxID=1828179 RepID=UPI0011CD8452|nr:hypothetical protein [Streptomyces sp. uw30]TXS35440.1 hypothetical protein EAO75_44540 [Streptomyces sp. uw30]